VLFPGGRLPLRIFEPRYVRMMKDCIRDNSHFGVCLIKEGNEAGSPAIPENLGCSASIQQWDMPHLGLFQIFARGERVFQLLDHHAEKDGLIRGMVAFQDDQPLAKVPEELEPCREVLRQFIERVGPSHFPSPIQLNDAGWVSYRLGELLPVESDTKQQLLGMRDDLARLSLIDQILDSQRDSTQT
jgi:uncharacterized protein